MVPPQPSPWGPQRLVHPSGIACCLIRLRLAGGGLAAFLAHWLLIGLFGIDVGRGAAVGPGLLIPHPNGIVIGTGAMIGARATVYQRVTVGKGFRGDFPAIEDGVTLLPGAVIAGRCRIGRGALIGANCVVSADVPAGHVVKAPATASDAASGAWRP